MIKDLIAIGDQLSAIQRYSQTKLTNPESVLEHQGFVAITSLMITWRLNILGEDFNLERILCSAIIHDIDEIGTGDVSRPTKYSNPILHKMLDELAEESVQKISNELNLPCVSYTWLQAKAGKDGIIVSLCDGLAVLYKVWQEVVLFGNVSIISHAGPIGTILHEKFSDLISLCETADGIDFVAKMRTEAIELLGEIEKRKVAF